MSDFDVNVLKLENLKVEKTELKSPLLTELAEALSEGLANEFADVVVDVVDCPNLTLAPFNLAAEGLLGDPTVVQVGDASYVVPVTLKGKLYDFRDVPKALGLKRVLIIGAGGGCWPAVDGRFCEMCANVCVDGNDIHNFTKQVYSKDETLEGVTVESSHVKETRFSCLGSLYVCRGNSGKVVRVVCKRRKAGNGDFPACINSSIKKAFSYPVAVGVVVQMTRGKATHHVAPKFFKGASSTAELMKELLLPDVSAPFTSVGTLLTFNPPGWKVQHQHLHSFNDRNEGGHYHNDVTPEDAEYLAYIVPATKLCSIDKPTDLAIDIFNY